MKLFISWSGHKSKTVALKLKEWIHDVLQTVEPWMSERDIEAGARWSPQVAAALEETRFGVICLTKDNAMAPWLLFETGALAKTIEGTFVCPYLIDMEPTDIPAGPLPQFQAKRANENETLDLIRTINGAVKDGRLTEEQLTRAFQRWWPDLRETLLALPEHEAPAPRRSPDKMIEEVLDIVRDLSRRDLSSRLTIENAPKKLVDVVRETVLKKGFNPSGPQLPPSQSPSLTLHARHQRPLPDDNQAEPMPSASPSPSGEREDES